HGALPARPAVRFRPERADTLVGLEVPAGEQLALLGRLGFDVAGDEVTVPAWRARGVTRGGDVVEGGGRFHLGEGPCTVPLRRPMFGRLTRDQRLRRKVEDVLTGLSFSEVYTPSLVEEDPDSGAVRLNEPISVELAVLRTTLLP